MKASTWTKVLFAGLLFMGPLRADAGTVRKGRMCDVTGNTKVTSFDAVWVLQFIAGTRDLNSDEQYLADASGNGVVTAYDAALIMKASTGAVMPDIDCGESVPLP